MHDIAYVIVQRGGGSVRLWKGGWEWAGVTSSRICEVKLPKLVDLQTEVIVPKEGI